VGYDPYERNWKSFVAYLRRMCFVWAAWYFLSVIALAAGYAGWLIYRFPR
jgi:hypothetical protein